MNIDELEKLIELMNSNDLVELEIESEEHRIRLRKGGSEPSIVMGAPYSAPMPGYAAPPVHAPGAPAAAAPETETASVEGDSVTFNSPMVGTFYTASSPTAKPFIKVGDKVGSSTVICIIEAMKVMNEITADMEGEVLEVLVGNGEGIEYNQPLFTLKPR